MSDIDREPAAYLAFADDGSGAVYMTDAEAQAAAKAWGWKVAPLFFAPTLTDAEREAVKWYAGIEGAARPAGARTTLRGLLERTGVPSE